jgi:galactokinase/mevalonate kinase-like predicted kinase
MYGGSVISCTVRERATCRIDLGGDGVEISNSGLAATVRTKEELRLKGDTLDIARAALTYFEIDPAATPMSIRLSTEIPMRAGLSGSTAMLGTLVGAFDALLRLNLNPYALAETLRKIENRIMGVVCGFQDQHMAIFGGLNFMDFAGKEQLEQRDDEPLATIEPLAQRVTMPPILLAHTGVQHHSGQVHSSPRERWLAGEPLVRRNYARIAELARTGKRALVQQDWTRLGELMNENHALVAELGGSGPDNERLIAAARDAGAWGAKLAGAGGGGTILALAADPETVGAALTAAGAERLLVPAPMPGLLVELK